MNDSINKYRRMYVSVVLFNLQWAQRDRPRTTKAPASRQLSAGRTRYGAMSARLALGTVHPAPNMSYHHSCLSYVTWRGEGDVRDVMDEPKRPCFFSRYVRIVARTTFAVVNNLYCIPAYVLWMMALRLLKPLFAPIYWKIEGLMYHWLLAMVSLWSWTAGYESKYFYIHAKIIIGEYIKH